MEAIPQPKPKTVDDVFRIIKRWRAGVIKALTTDVEKFEEDVATFHEQFGFENLTNLCLFVHPDESWEVYVFDKTLPPKNLSALDINICRDGMQEKKWLCKVAINSDSWLHSAANIYGYDAKFGFDERKSLFDMMNDLPTIYDIVHEYPTKPVERPPPPKDAFCGACGDNPQHDDFWIDCHICKTWFHGVCVQITSAEAEEIKWYSCLGCSIVWCVKEN